MNQNSQKWSPSQFQHYNNAEHDACGIVAIIEKENFPTRKNVLDCLNALTTINHRAGFVEGEGDGVGIHMDIPVDLWKKKLQLTGLSGNEVTHPSFSVAHLFIDNKTDATKTIHNIHQLFEQNGWNILFSSTNEVNSTVLGPISKKEEPTFLQLALLPKNEKVVHDHEYITLTLALEENEFIHVSSFSQTIAVYKVMGDAKTLENYYSDLQDDMTASAMTLGHNRYSTNTLSNFFRVQPFTIIGHNGEINTISKLREEASSLGVTLTNGGSDSQDVNRLLDTLIHVHQFSLLEAIEVVFPPIISEINSYEPELFYLYNYLRQAWGHFAQGPAGIISRFKNEAVFSNDSLGLRPLWMFDTKTSYLFCSETGILSTNEMISEPKPLSPGEKVAIIYDTEGQSNVLYYEEFQKEVFTRFKKRGTVQESLQIIEKQATPNEKEATVNTQLLAAFGWDREHIQVLEQMAEKGVEPIRSLGHDVPLAALDKERVNISDFIKESVAVVTNPAIDRDRETEHFSTQVYLGERPSLAQIEEKRGLFLQSPLLLDGTTGELLFTKQAQPSFESVISYFKEANLVGEISLTMFETETVKNALDRLKQEVSSLLEEKKSIILLHDYKSHQDGHLFLDPHLCLGAIHQHLLSVGASRKASLILSSAAIRSLHDVMVAIGFGATAIHPYIMFESIDEPTHESSLRLFSALNKGMEKVISTIGIHELRGYGKLFSSIGLHDEIQEELQIVNFFGGDDVLYSFDYMKTDSLKRRDDFSNETAKMRKSYHIFPRIWKSIGDIALGKGYDGYREKTDEIEAATPISIRHILDIKEEETTITKDEVSLQVLDHSLPFVISSMSFGSQNEVAFRAYAEAAERLNMISLNGEGGEIKDMIGKYPRTRGQQIASGRFGVNSHLVNSSRLLEIKIGQGAKPGEGGHLPGSKVTAKIAEARNATIGSDLISPSNNHDIYSIEDLSQMISELKSANDEARIIVKVPIVPNIGTIAVGVAKAGADIISLSGFDGGTGAARIHALTHVGLPIEIGVKAAHNALLESGLRNNVEVWADGGVRSAKDAVKLMLLGANRIGFGTLSMIAIGCTTCRGCHLDTCHVGIATQIETEVQAKEHGLRRFTPRQLESAVQNLVTFYTSFGDEIKQILSKLGATSLQEVVGRSSLLKKKDESNHLNVNTLITELQGYDLSVLKGKVEKTITPNNIEKEEIHSSIHYKTIGAEERNVAIKTVGYQSRKSIYNNETLEKPITFRLTEGSIPGNGLAAYNGDGMKVLVEGGAQDGVGKTSFGGEISILKSLGAAGKFIHGSVGKGFAYGAQKGVFLVQGNADARAGIRLSGADLIFGGALQREIPEKEFGRIGVHANIKGFAFEYMTNGRALVLGDPGPWICAGMTGGVVYLRHQPEKGLTIKAIERRLANGAAVSITSVSDNGKSDIEELLTIYINALLESNQLVEANSINNLLNDVKKHFVQIIPIKEQADPSVSTE